MDKKKILHILSTSKISGAENVAADICMMFNKKYEMIYCSLDGKIRESIEDRELKFIPLKSLNYFKIKEIIKKEKPDLIHAHDIKATILSVLASKNIPVISHLHGNSENMRKRTLKSFLYKEACKRVKKVIYVSKSCLEEYYYKDKISYKSIYLRNIVYPNRIDKLKELDKKNYNFDFCYCGRLAYAKDPERLAELASQIIKKRNYKFGIIGEGDYKEKMIKIFKENNTIDNVIFTGNLKYPYKALSQSKVMLMSSRFEGTPIVAIESLILGTPIVSTRTDGMIELLEDNVTGYLLENNEDIVKKVVELIEDKEKRNFIKNNIENKIKDINNCNEYFKKLNKIYNV